MVRFLLAHFRKSLHLLEREIIDQVDQRRE